MRTSLVALIAAGCLGGSVILPPPALMLMPGPAWAASVGDANGAAPAGAGGALPAADPQLKDPTSSFAQQVIGHIDRPPGDWLENPVNYITFVPAVASRRWIRQVVAQCEDGSQVIVTTPSISPDTGVFGYVFPVSAPANRCGSAFIAFYTQPCEGFELRIVERFELNNVPAAPGYLDRTPAGAFARFVNPGTGSDANTGTSSTAGSGSTGPWKTLLKALASAPDGGCVYVEPGTTLVEDACNFAGMGAPQLNFRRIDVKPRVVGGTYSLSRSSKTFSTAKGTIQVDGSGNFTIAGATGYTLTNANGLAVGWPLLIPATGDKRYITSFTAGTGGAATGALSAPLSQTLAGPTSFMAARLSASMGGIHSLNARHVGIFGCTVDMSKFTTIVSTQGVTPATFSLAPSAATGAYILFPRIWWQGCSFIDPNGDIGPMAQYAGNPAFPYPAPQPGVAGSGYYDNGGDPENEDAYVSYMASNVPSTTPANDPYDQTVSFVGFGECSLQCIGIAGDVLRRNCSGTISRDINFLNQNNVRQFNNRIGVINECYFRVHRDPVLVVSGTPTFDGVRSTITLKGQPHFGSVAAFGLYQDAHFLTVGGQSNIPATAIAYNSFRAATDLASGTAGATGVQGQPNQSSVRATDFRWASVNGGIGYNTSGLALTPAGTTTVVIYGDVSPTGLNVQDGDLMVLWSGQHSDISQYGNPPAGGVPGSKGHQNLIFQHNHYFGYALQWLIQESGSTSGSNAPKALPVPGGTTLTTDGSTATATFSNAVTLNVGDMIVCSKAGTASATAAVNQNQVVVDTPAPVGSQILISNAAGTSVQHTRWVKAVAASNGGAPYTLTLDAPLYPGGGAVPQGAKVLYNMASGVLAVAGNGLSATLADVLPPTSNADFTREIGVRTSGTAVSFSSPVTAQLAPNDGLVVASGLQTQAYSRVLTISADGMSATLSKPIQWFDGSGTTLSNGSGTISQFDQAAWVRWAQAKSATGVAWLGNILENFYDGTGQQAAALGSPLGQIQNGAMNWVYAQNTIGQNAVATTPAAFDTVNNQVNFAIEDVCLFDNILPSAQSGGTSHYPMVKSGPSANGPYQGLRSDNNHWAVDPGSTGGMIRSLTTGIAAIENTTGGGTGEAAEVGVVNFDNIGTIANIRTATYNPLANQAANSGSAPGAGTLTRAPRGNATTGGLLLPCMVDAVTGVLTPLPLPASGYVVGARPLAA